MLLFFALVDLLQLWVTGRRLSIHLSPRLADGFFSAAPQRRSSSSFETTENKIHSATKDRKAHRHRCEAPTGRHRRLDTARRTNQNEPKVCVLKRSQTRLKAKRKITAHNEAKCHSMLTYTCTRTKKRATRARLAKHPPHSKTYT